MYLDVFGGLLGLWSAAAVPPAVGILGAAYEVPSNARIEHSHALVQGIQWGL